MADENKIVVESEDGDTAEVTDLSTVAKSDQQTEELTTENNSTVDELTAEIEKLKSELKDKNDKFVRLQADFDNFRKRTAKEKSELAATIEQAFLKDLLPLLDNLSRATEAVESSENSDIDSLKKGIEMIRQETAAAMGKHGLEPIETEGKMFDPNFHQAVSRINNPDLEEGAIAAELQRGYIARGRVIRPSMVQVVNNE